MRRRNGADKSCGFAIYSDPEHAIKDAAHERYAGESGGPGVRKYVTKDGTITDAGWDQLNKDIARIERNALAWLKKEFNSARDDGHSGDELVGSVWYDPENKNQLELLEIGQKERIDFSDTSYGDFRTALEGVSAFGESVLGGGIVFFDVDEEF